MKFENRNDSGYGKFVRKVFLQAVFLMGLSVLIIGSVYMFVWRDNVGDWLVSFFQVVFHISYNDALRLYHVALRQNYEFIFIGAVAVTFIILIGFSLRRFTRYFDSINNGINALLDDTGGDIVLEPEMEAIEKKLNAVRLTLEQRSRDARLAEQRKNDLVMYLAHDIKTPLTSVIGYLSLLDEAKDMPPEQRTKNLRITLEKAYRLEQLIDEFFEITRYNLQTIALSKESIDLYYMLVQMTDEFYPLLTSAGKEVIINAAEDLWICGDPDKLARVFNNILKNAIAYSPDNSVIDITATALGDVVTVVFRNAGTIQEDKLKSIFDKFYRLDSARSSKTGGAGLGLAVAKEIIDLHGGSIYASSSEGYTEFTVKLPAGGLPKEVGSWS